MKAVISILVLVLGASALQTDFNDEAWKNRPVSKVINLLKDMQAELQHEAETDGEMYDKLACWCQTNDKEKTKAIADGETRITDLNSAIEEYTAKSATLKVDIEKLQKSIAENNDALSKATEIREKESADFIASEKDMIQSITSLKGAVIAMSKTHGEAFVQQQLHLPKDVQQLVQNQLSLIQTGSRLRSQQSQPQSGAIFGILKQMKETFEKNLATAQKDEETATAEYAELKSGKEAELKAADDLSTTKTADLAEADEKAATSKQDLKDTRGALAADTEFLANLKTKCESMDREFEERTKTRQDEIAAVSETIGILNDDDAKDMFSSTLGFVQLSSSPTRAAAARAVSKALAVSGDVRLVQLAAKVRQDPMAAVKESVDKMVEDLKQQRSDESKERDQCNEDLHLNEKTTAEKENEKENLNTNIADLESAISNLNDDIASLKAEVADAQVEMKRASENREKENAEFQQTVADQRATQTILKKALTRLQQFYAKKASFIQAKSRRQAPPGEFGERKGASAGAGGVVAMLENIINDSKRMENEALGAEQDAQTAYESFITDSNKAIGKAQTEVANKQEEVSKTDAEKITSQGDLKATMDELQSLSELNAGLHGNCDFLLKNFEIRQASLDQEIEALRQSKSILSGAQ